MAAVALLIPNRLQVVLLKSLLGITGASTAAGTTGPSCIHIDARAVLIDNAEAPSIDNLRGVVRMFNAKGTIPALAAVVLR